MWPLWLFFIAVSYCIMKYWELRSLLAWQKYLPAPPSKNILLVTAHPDDEVMFFSPLINSLKYFTTSTVHVLCLSAGHFRDARDPNLGKIRSAELAKAVQELRVDRFEIADRVDGTEVRQVLSNWLSYLTWPCDSSRSRVGTLKVLALLYTSTTKSTTSTKCLLLTPMA
jgi:hypothetical protein